MKKSNTKRALIAGIASVTLCTAMLVGTSYAWFTDSVSAGVNKIVSGTLDIDLVDGEGNSLEDKTLDFVKADGTDEVLWEPGCTYKLPEVKIVNKGKLALKYKIGVSGIEGDSELLEAIEWTIKIGENEVDLADFEGHLAAGDSSSEAFELIGHMKEDAGNEYQNKEASGISITVTAAQDTVEYDSFNNTYDENATYPVITSNFAEVLENGGSMTMTEDIKFENGLDSPVTLAEGSVLDLNGKDISSPNMGLILQGNDLTIKNGTFTGLNGASYGLFVGDEGETDNVVIENITAAGGLNIYNASNVILRNCEIHATNYYAVWADYNAHIIIESGTYYDGGKGNPVLAASKGDASTGAPAGEIIVRGGSFSTDPTAFVDTSVYDVTLDTASQMYVVTPKK